MALNTDTHATKSETKNDDQGFAHAKPRPRSATAPRRNNVAATGTGTRRDAQFDLLTAALIGAAVGAGITLLLRQNSRGSRPIVPLLKAAQRGAKMAGLAGSNAAGWAWDRIPHEEMSDSIQDYVQSARDAIEQTVERELKQLRKAARTQRRRMHL